MTDIIMVGAILGTALKVGGTIWGGLESARAAQAVKASIEQRRKDNQLWYDRTYNEDPTQRASAQRMISMVADNIRNRNRQAAGAQAVMGGTEESVAATKEANNRALSDAAARVSAIGEARKDAIEQQYRMADNAMAGQLEHIEQQRSSAIGNAVSSLTGVGAGLLESSIPGGEDQEQQAKMP